MRTAVALLLLACLSCAIDIQYYYGEGCPHCAATEAALADLQDDYGLVIDKHEVYHDAVMRERMFMEYDAHGVDIRNGGVPTTIIDGRTFIVGQMEKDEWAGLFEECEEGCPERVLTHESSAFMESDGTAQITLPIILGAALVDSINPCTIAVMIILISAVLYSKGRRDALTLGIIFASTIFIMYLLYGFGILHAITTFELTRLFYTIVTAMAFILALLEVRAFIDYRPGMMAVEMPMFLRPHVKSVASGATSPIAVVIAAMLCSVFLLPCSSGPYLIVLGLIAKAATLVTISYLILYNLIFVLPMLVISVLIYLGKTTVQKVGAAKDRYIRYIHLVSGIILFILFFLMLTQLQQVF